MPILVEGQSADEVWCRAAAKLMLTGRTQSSRLGPTKELVNVTLSISNPVDRMVFSRPINPAFALAEVIWILSGSDDLAFLTAWNSRMRRYADSPNEWLYGAYGRRLGVWLPLGESAAARLSGSGKWSPLNQLKQASEALSEDPNSRQIVVQIWDPEKDLPNPRVRSRDVPCNLSGQALLRGGRLSWTQYMRSTDLVWGLPYNVIQWTTIQEVVAGWLGVPLGEFTLVTTSLHAYREHWREIDSWISGPATLPASPPPRLPRLSYNDWELQFAIVVGLAVDLGGARDADEVEEILMRLTKESKGYSRWVRILAAERLRRLGHLVPGRRMAQLAGNYLARSWENWASSKAKEPGKL